MSCEPAMAAARLTPNGVRATLAGDLDLKPVLQVLDFKSISVNGRPGSAPRFRILVSDGADTTSMLLASQMCDLALSGLVRRGTIVQLTGYIVNSVNGRRSVDLSAASLLLDRWIACGLVAAVLGFGRAASFILTSHIFSLSYGLPVCD